MVFNYSLNLDLFISNKFQTTHLKILYYKQLQTFLITIIFVMNVIEELINYIVYFVIL